MGEEESGGNEMTGPETAAQSGVTGSQSEATIEGGAPKEELTRALESTLSSLTESIDRMETIVEKLEMGETDWEESIRLLTEANELAMGSSQRLEQAVQDVIYGSGEQGEQLELAGDEDGEG